MWEAGITMARYIYQNPEKFAAKTILELGSGTGIGGIAALKYTESSKVVFTDYTEEVNQLLSENIKLQGISKSSEIHLVDWTKPGDYDKVASNPIDIVIATDVIYKGSPYSDMANLLLLVCQRNTHAEIMIIIPK